MRRVQALLFVLLFGSFAYFYHMSPGWNVQSRLCLTYAMVEKHTFRIDQYLNRPGMQTGDAALFEGHYYSDKIIGTSLLGFPPYWVVRTLENVLDTSIGTALRRYLVTLFAICLPGALSGVLLFRILILHSSEERWVGPFVITAAISLGTVLFLYSGLYMSYMPAQFFLLAGLYVFERWRLTQPEGSVPPAFLCGILTGAAVLCEYMDLIAVGLLGLCIIAATRYRITAAIKFGTGVFLGVLPFFLYTYHIFHAVTIPYQYHAVSRFKTEMARGLMGATVPDLDVLWLLTFHPFRGIFVHSPMLLAGLAGLYIMWKYRNARLMAIYVAVALICYLLFNSAYYMWWGGWAFGPRHLAPCLPLLAIPMVYAWRYKAGRIGIALLSIPAILVHLVVNTTDPQTRENGIRHLLDADMGKYDYPYVFVTDVMPEYMAGRTDANLGTLVGLPPGGPSLVPLLAFWIVILLICLKLSKKSDLLGAQMDVTLPSQTANP